MHQEWALSTVFGGAKRFNFTILLTLHILGSVHALSCMSLRRPVRMSAATQTDNQSDDVRQVHVNTLIIGAGISGLSCARTLSLSNYSDYLIIDSQSAVGGRVQSEIVDGYTLDKGFQVFIDSYPEAKRSFDYKALKMRKFAAGALIRYKGSFHLVSDPLRQPQKAWRVVQSPIGTFADKLKVGVLAAKLLAGGSTTQECDTSTQEYLRDTVGLSNSMIDRFFKPFFQGIFLSSLNMQSSRMFEFVFKMFLKGSATLPAEGMSAVPIQLSKEINADQILLRTRVGTVVYREGGPSSTGRYEVHAHNVGTKQPLTVHCEQLVVATDEVSAARLLEQVAPPETKNETHIPATADTVTSNPGRGVTCLYFAFNGTPPVLDPVLILNRENSVTEGEFTTTINNMCFPSQISSTYAPKGKSLASATLIGCPTTAQGDTYSDVVLEREVRAQLTDWYGAAVVDKWRLLRIYRIPYAQPKQRLPYNMDGQQGEPGGSNQLRGLYVCGDHTDTGTLNGALRSGRHVAEHLLSSLPPGKL